jgi:hypothetical protein
MHYCKLITVCWYLSSSLILKRDFCNWRLLLTRKLLNKKLLVVKLKSSLESLTVNTGTWLPVTELSVSQMNCNYDRWNIYDTFTGTDYSCDDFNLNICICRIKNHVSSSLIFVTVIYNMLDMRIWKEL